ncbi:MAG: cell wall hydrolase [Eubacteriales bacterium]
MRKTKKSRKNVFIPTLLIALFASLALPAAADCLYETETPDFDVVVDGFAYEGSLLSVNDIAYVSLREFACMADNSVVWWDEEECAAYVRTDSLTLRAPEDEFYLEANGRMLWCEYGVFTENDILYVPLSRAAKAFGFDTTYVFEDNTTYLTRLCSAVVPAEDYYDKDEVYWLSKIIHAEAQGEPLLGKIAVGNVILNRVESEEFPDTIYEVIFDNDHGVQFTPTINGAIEQDPNEESIAAAKLCLDGAVLSEAILYFLNESIATSLWIPQNCKFVMSIGGHEFYA